MTAPAPSSAIAKENYRRSLQKMEALNGNMALLARLGAMLREADSGIDQVVTLLRTDGALCATIVRISNSAAYAQGARSVDVRDALAKIGYNRVLTLVGAALSQRLFMRDLLAYGLSADDYWSYSYFCGVLLESRAHLAGVPPDDAYLVGLLHSIGRVVINDLLGQTKIEIYWDRAIPCEEWEDLLIGFRHDEAGSHLLHGWRFPAAIYERVATQRFTRALREDRLLLLLDYARCCAELNYCRLEVENWALPANHTLAREKDFDAEAMRQAVESARKACLDIRHVIQGGGK